MSKERQEIKEDGFLGRKEIARRRKTRKKERGKEWRERRVYMVRGRARRDEEGERNGQKTRWIKKSNG